MATKKPEFETVGPIWWHHHGGKMKVVAMSLGNKFLVIQGSAAELMISKAQSGWYVDWRVIQSQTESSCGRVFMNNADLAQAFGLEDGKPESPSNWLIDRYGATVARQRKFIRYEDYLNIPCPGTGHDGDPNVSIELDQKMKDAVSGLVCRERIC